MKPGKARFQFQIAKIETLVNQSVAQSNQAYWLFTQDLRTPMFMLQGLAKLYAEINDDDIFTKLKEEFKLIEDSLGDVDHFAAYQKELAIDNEVPAAIIDYFKRKTDESLTILEENLNNEGWLNGKKIKAINKILDEIEWDDEEKETKLLNKFYTKQIKKINEFVEETGFPLTDIEEHVHEIRRRIRWLSIYPKALNGAVKFSEISTNEKYLEKYLTADVLNSPFNVMPISDLQTEFLIFDKNKFLALSSMISQLGVLKDKGLKITALKEAFLEVSSLNDEDAFTQTYELLGNDYPTLEKILAEASDKLKIFFEENNLDFVIK